MKRTIGLISIAIVAAARLAAFSAPGHRTVAAIAMPLLNANARAAVTTILDGESPLDAAVWPDEIKPPFGALARTAEAHEFNREHKDNKHWHYVNFPVGSKGYSGSSAFAYPHDVVHIINGCIAVLQGNSFEDLSKKDALRYLIHLVGDIHQPLHVCAGFYDVSDELHPKLLSKVSSPNDAVSDSGGNALFYAHSAELHAYWDKVLVKDIDDTNNPATLAAYLMQSVDPKKYATSGPVTGWAAKWATDSMRTAAVIYADVAFGEATEDSRGDLRRMGISLEPSTAAYRAKFTAVEAEQLRKAGVHLAQLLNAIQWEDADIGESATMAAK